MTLNDVMAIILRYLTEFVAFGAHYIRKSDWR